MGMEFSSIDSILGNIEQGTQRSMTSLLNTALNINNDDHCTNKWSNHKAIVMCIIIIPYQRQIFMSELELTFLLKY